MGLDTTHDCWSGSYSSFNAFRTAIAAAIGLRYDSVPGNRAMIDMTGWPTPETEPLIVLLAHSDCDGVIAHADCARLADRLDEIATRMDRIHWGDTFRFIAGLRAANRAGEDVEFG